MGWRDQYFEDGYLKRWGLDPPDKARFEAAERIMALSGVPSTARVLDLGCGHGAYSLALAKGGADVFGLDASTTLLRRARTHTDGRPYSARWIRGDMRAIPFRRHFDMVLIFSAFGYFDNDDEALLLLREVGRVLQSAGRLMMRNPNATRIRENFRPLIEEERGGRTVSIHSTFDEPGHWMEQNVIIEDEHGLHEYERRQRIYSARELEDLLGESGFRSIEHFADAGGSLFDEHASPGLCTICRSA